tara:strand:- start:156 stop:386 length:231 start_codon:yes stop_codon:yes gene_type:complete
MNRKEMEKEIWRSLLVVACNLNDFDAPKYNEIKYGFIDDEWDCAYSDPIKPRTSKAHQKRFDKALDRVIEILQNRV